ncbi:partial Transposon Tn7 transposition protein TnsA, partial [biofilm metagenome]
MSLSNNKCKEVKEIAFKVAEKRFKEGRGSGSGREYKPFLTVRDISSKGRSHRLPSITVGRAHHLLSDLELHVFYLLDWDPDVIDIREQFPITLSSSQSIAEQMGIAHPSVKGIDQVVTTDFIVDLQMQGRTIRKAISVKYADELDNPRTIEKLELERRYWEEKHIPFCIVTELQIPKPFVKNVQWFQPYLTAHSFKPDEQVEYFELFHSSFARHGSIKVTAITAKLD